MALPVQCTHWEQCWVVIKECDLDSSQIWFESQLYSFWAVWLWADSLPSPAFHSSLCKMDIVTIELLRGFRVLIYLKCVQQDLAYSTDRHVSCCSCLILSFFFFLAMPCGMWDLGKSHKISFFLAVLLDMWNLPNQRWNPCPLQCKHGVLTTGPPGRS